MKPSERIEEIYRTRKDMTLAGSIIQYLDEQAELLETHTVKEPCIFDDIEGHKEKCACPTTPEKKCCFNCGIGSDGCANKDCPCHQSESIELEEIDQST